MSVARTAALACIGASVLLMLSALLSYAHNSEAEQAELAKSFQIALVNSRMVRVFHVPSGSIESNLSKLESIKETWKYKIAVKCQVNCSYYPHFPIAPLIKDATKFDSDCPLPINSLIQLVSASNDVVFEAFVHPSGQCFVVDGQSYLSDYRFDPLKFLESN